MKYYPTEQQKKVINHVNGHARVLAVAGSGKTTTMVFRIKNLIENHNVDPKKIRVLMFNRKAAEDFKKKARENISVKVPYISTFHSFSYQFIEMLMKDGVMAKYEYWIDEHAFRVDTLLHKIASKFGKEDRINRANFDLEEMKTSISLWKSMLVEPENAGHRYNKDYELIYKEFELQRNQAKALTYDDFIPLTVEILSKENDYRKKWSNKTHYLIVDEYQDVNLGQQRLIELLAGETAHIMAVGDDDQTIYEWRGARPEYILKEFETTFTSKPHTIFKLDRTFRFGPLLAQYAQNCISLNSTRHPKNVFASDVTSESDIEIIISSSKKVFDTNDELAKIAARLVKEDSIPPSKIRIISRLYSQFTGIEASFLYREIPYKIEGNIPFYKRREVQILVDYMCLFENLFSKINNGIISNLLNIVNTPNRKIKKAPLESFLKRNKGLSLIDCLDTYSKNYSNDKFEKLVSFLIDGNAFMEEVMVGENYNSSKLVKWTYENSELENHYLNYYGEGEEATSKISTTIGFIQFCRKLKLTPKNLRNYLENLDSTFGLDDDQIIIMSTVHKTKGIEYDYVFIPDCIEGNMPFISSNQISVFDKENQDLDTKLSDSLESERRLFYVAITRAIKKVYLGTTLSEVNKPSRFFEEMLHARTKKVLHPLVKNEFKIEEWLKDIKPELGLKKLMENVKLYLDKLGYDDLRRKVDDVSFRVPEEEFKYKYAYPSRRNLQMPDVTDSSNPWSRANTD